MRVQYTIPGIAPETNIPETPPVLLAPSFKSRLRRLAAPVPRTWRRLLGIDESPMGAASIGPPPKPASLEIADPAEERTRWRNLLERHAGPLLGRNGANPAHPAQRMMALLIRYRQLQDEVAARQLSESAE